MDVRVLRYFLAVAQEESISRAAELLHLTQPTLSRQLMDLEDELGRKLFYRGSRKVTITEDGLLLRKRAREIVELMDKTVAAFQEADEGVAGDVCIGAGETAAMRLIAGVAKEVKARYPRIRYHLYSGNADDVSERLEKGLLDFGILIEPVDLEKYDYLKLPATDAWGVLMRQDSPLAQKDVITPKDLQNEPIITSRQSMAQRDLARWLGREIADLELVATYNLLFNAAILVEEGLGYALTLDKLVNTMAVDQLCFRPLQPKIEVGLDIVWKKHPFPSRACQKFLECLWERFPQGL